MMNLGELLFMDTITRKHTTRILLVLVGVSSASPLRETRVCWGLPICVMNVTLTGENYEDYSIDISNNLFIWLRNEPHWT